MSAYAENPQLLLTVATSIKPRRTNNQRSRSSVSETFTSQVVAGIQACGTGGASRTVVDADGPRIIKSPCHLVALAQSLFHRDSRRVSPGSSSRYASRLSTANSRGIRYPRPSGDLRFQASQLLVHFLRPETPSLIVCAGSLRGRVGADSQCQHNKVGTPLSLDSREN